MTSDKGASAPGFRTIDEAVASLRDANRKLRLAGLRLRQAGDLREALIVEKSQFELSKIIALLRKSGDG